MADITVRNLDDDLKVMLQIQAKEKGRSMEEEVRRILHKAVADRQGGAGTLIASYFKDLDFEFELEPLPKGTLKPAEFDD